MTTEKRIRSRKSHVLARVQVELLWPTWLWFCGNTIYVLSVHKKRPCSTGSGKKRLNGSLDTTNGIVALSCRTLRPKVFSDMVEVWYTVMRDQSICLYSPFCWAVVHFDKNLCINICASRRAQSKAELLGLS